MSISKRSDTLSCYVFLSRLSNKLLFETREKGYCGRVRNLTDYDVSIMKSDSKLLTLYPAAQCFAEARFHDS